MRKMKKSKWIGGAAALLLLGAACLYLYQRRGASSSSVRDGLLDRMPGDASAVVFADLAELRSSPFVAQLFAWAPQPEPDEDYARFLKETGFNYEHDLDQLAVGFFKNTFHDKFLAVVVGRFDQQKIMSYALQHGKWSLAENNKREFFVPLGGSSRMLSFMFLQDDELILANDDVGFEKLHDALHSDARRVEWRSRFERLGGSPVFAVIRQDAAPGEALTERAPGGFSSPQLSTALDRLQWITLAGKPENDRLHVVAEGECASDDTARQLADLLNGVLALAEAGLNDTKTRQQLNPSLREAYVALLKSADVSKLNRGDTKSVRLAFEITPAFLESARRASIGSTAPPAKPVPGSPAARSKKGRS